MRNVLPFKMLMLLQSAPVASTQSRVCALLLGVTLWITELRSQRLPSLPVSTSSHACHNYFHSRTRACRYFPNISGSRERHCMNFLWSMTCLISLGRLKHVTLKFSSLCLLNKSCLFTRDDEIISHVLHSTGLQKSESHLFWPMLVIINSN